MNDGPLSSRQPTAEDAKLANMNRMILPLLLLSCLTFGGGCASERPRDIQTYNANLNRLKIGMTTKKVSALVGPPIRSEQAATAAGTIVEWYYVESQFMAAGDAVVTGLQQYAGTRSGQRGTKVTFTNGRVSSIQSASATP
jgi:outer membrane protein assembly factor BamE (lipoprotein component of BamABCDE complex)